MSHLTFEVDTTKAFAPVFDVTNYWAWNQQFANVIKTCDFISLHLPNLLTIRIFIRLLPEQARYLVEKEGDTPVSNLLEELSVPLIGCFWSAPKVLKVPRHSDTPFYFKFLLD